MINASKSLLFLALILTLTVISCGGDEPMNPTGNNDPIELDCSINNDMTLTNDPDKPVDYIVACVIDINAKLVIEAGTVIEFKNDTGFEVTSESGAAIIAKGSATSPIIMRGTSDVAGFWKGLHIENNNPTNELNYVTVSGGGSGSFTGLDTKAAIRVGEVGAPGSIKIINSTIEKTDGFGISISEYSERDAIKNFSTNIIKDGTSNPIEMSSIHVHELDQNSTFSANTKNTIYLNDGNGRLLGDHIWNNPGIPFTINESILVGYSSEQGSLTINEGVELQFQSNQALRVNHTGYIAVKGSASNPVKLGGETPVAGAWKGIYVTSNDVRNSIDYCILTDGGSSSHDGADIKALVRLATVGSCCDNAKLKISNSTLARADCLYSIYNENNSLLTEINVTKVDYTNEYCN